MSLFTGPINTGVLHTILGKELAGTSCRENIISLLLQHTGCLEMLHKKEIDMVVNIPKNLTAGELDNGYKIRRAAIDLNIPLITNARLASAFINAFCTMDIDDIAIKSWEEYK